MENNLLEELDFISFSENIDETEQEETIKGERPFEEGKVLIKLKNFEDYTLQGKSSLFNELNVEPLSTIPMFGIEVVQLGETGENVLNVPEFIERYSNDERFEYLTPSFTDTQLSVLHPNDYFYSNPLGSSNGEGYLWGLNNVGQAPFNGTIDADINAPEAWDYTTPEGITPNTGGPSVVAVLDTGVDYNHPDLVNNIHSFQWDYYNNDNDAMDGHSHGTHVAGTIGAEGNNSIGVVGVNWDVEIMPLKIFSDTGAYAGDAAVIQAIADAITNGADVINASYGSGPHPPGTSPSPAMVDAIEDAPLFVAAAGNNANDNDINPYFPANINLDNIISVAATDYNDDLASFSNFGANSVDLTAPGVSIASTVPGNSYAYKSGTSMAAPHVSGAAALMMSTRRARRDFYAPGSPMYDALDDLDSVELKEKVLNAITANTPSVSGTTATDGRLNLYNGIDQAGIGWGDVHFETFDGKKYDLQSFGDFILAETARKDDEWIVQTRQTPWVSNPSVSVNTAFATRVDGQTVVFNKDFPDNRLQVNGNDFPLASGEVKNIGNSTIERSGNQYTIKYAGNDDIIDIDDPKLTAFDNSSYINIHISDFATMQGLLGNNDGDSTNDFALRDGTQLPNNLTVEEIHKKYGESWRVQKGESLFEKPPSQIGIPEKFISLNDFPENQVDQAREKVFQAGITDENRIDAVALDLLATEDESFLEGAVQFFEFVENPNDLPPTNYPPNDIILDNNSVDENVVGGTTIGTFSTVDPDTEDTFSYSLNDATRNSIVDPGNFNPLWNVEGIADFNRDQIPDILWRHETLADNRIWLMDNDATRDSIVDPGSFNSNWHIVGM